ncbi:MAG: type I asparaginase [Fluviicola sp.]|jgi:L-asparaginase|nr:type I asparaginase [Fluviicola sp.]
MSTKNKVLIIYTGGTIGMINDPKSGRLISFDFKHMYHHIPELERLNIDLTTISFEYPVDSSEMHPSRWADIAQIVYDNYGLYDGFVILHGSDTMAYTASGLSFMLQGLKKPVILTGSQLPIGTIRTDGKENLITAIEIAASKDESGESIVQEVAVYFEYSLYRGNRSSKVSANQFEAFSSPNYAELAIAGVNIQFNKERLLRSDLSELKLFTHFDNHVALLKIFPGFSANVYKSIFDFQQVKGIIIETFGAGNAPSDVSFRELITNYINEGGIVLNITQCSSGSVEQGKYETSSFFSKIGVISGSDMTTEAALAKMMYLLGSESSLEVIKDKLSISLIGELSV